MNKAGELKVESIDKQVAVYMQGAEFGDPQIKEMMSGELRQRLIDAEAEGRPLRVYCGYDVTAPDLHLGHTITMRKLRQFQEYGHDVTFLIGTFTTLIGDPSDRDEARVQALEEQVAKNAQTYAEQALKILDPDKTRIRYNYEWLSKLSFADVISMASCFTVQQFLIRDRLRNRYDKNDPIWLRELLYPLAQGYDAVSLRADVQLGATEQLFNLMAGRKLQEVFGQKPQICLTFPVLVGTDGVQRMSKSIGNYIGITEPPDQIYGKVMSIPDSSILQYFELLTGVSAEGLAEIRNQLDNGDNPMSLKKHLAGDIVEWLYDKKEADKAEENFKRVVQNKELPDDLQEFRISFRDLSPRDTETTAIYLPRLLVIIGFAKSMSEARRLINQGAVVIDGDKVMSTIPYLDAASIVLKVGKRRFARIINIDRE
jgi:tyrosyl-tRNA synthetase